MKLRTLKDTDITGKTILYRSPYDIGVVEGTNGYVLKDTARIEATLPTLRYLLERECTIVILTYVKRPGGEVVEKLRTTPHAQALSDLLSHPVSKLDECVGEEVRNHIQSMSAGDIVMLENTRFHPEDQEDDDDFAKELALSGEVVVFDAFPQSHRSHSSVTGIMRHLPSVAGLYCETEVSALSGLLENDTHPFTMVIGGVKISDKVGAIQHLFERLDHVLVGGAVANLFFAAKGYDIGGSLIEESSVTESGEKEWFKVAQELLEGDTAGKIKLPKDIVVARKDGPTNGIQVLDVKEGAALVPEGYAIYDIGPKTQRWFADLIAESKKVFWNGPMGLTETEPFDEGTLAVASGLQQVEGGDTVIGGGDTIEAVSSVDLSSVSHKSLAGGATLAFLAGENLPALEMLRD